LEHLRGILARVLLLTLAAAALALRLLGRHVLEQVLELLHQLLHLLIAAAGALATAAAPPDPIAVVIEVVAPEFSALKPVVHSHSHRYIHGLSFSRRERPSWASSTNAPDVFSGIGLSAARVASCVKIEKFR
jgi:hypothetical protein